jgi:hypothetical protein
MRLLAEAGTSTVYVTLLLFYEQILNKQICELRSLQSIALKLPMTNCINISGYLNRVVISHSDYCNGNAHWYNV